jgi:hypothetical protein
VTTNYSPSSQQAAFAGAMNFDCLKSVVRASRVVPANLTDSRAQQNLIAANNANQDRHKKPAESQRPQILYRIKELAHDLTNFERANLRFSDSWEKVA